MTRHDRNFGARKQLFHAFQKLETGHVGHHHVSQNDMSRLLLEQGKSRFAAIRFDTSETERLTHSHAQFADALFVIHNQQANT